MMENKGCITCRKCEQVRSNFFCGRTRLSQKQLYNKHGFCSDYEQKEQIEKQMTNEAWLNTLSTTEEKAKWLYDHYVNARADEYYGRQEKTLSEYQKWLVSVHREIDGTKID